MKQMNHKR